MILFHKTFLSRVTITSSPCWHVALIRYNITTSPGLLEHISLRRLRAKICSCRPKNNHFQHATFPRKPPWAVVLWLLTISHVSNHNTQRQLETIISPKLRNRGQSCQKSTESPTEKSFRCWRHVTFIGTPIKTQQFYLDHCTFRRPHLCWDTRWRNSGL